MLGTEGRLSRGEPVWLASRPVIGGSHPHLTRAKIRPIRATVNPSLRFFRRLTSDPAPQEPPAGRRDRPGGWPDSRPNLAPKGPIGSPRGWVVAGSRRAQGQAEGPRWCPTRAGLGGWMGPSPNKANRIRKLRGFGERPHCYAECSARTRDEGPGAQDSSATSHKHESSRCQDSPALGVGGAIRDAARGTAALRLAAGRGARVAAGPARGRRPSGRPDRVAGFSGSRFSGAGRRRRGRRAVGRPGLLDPARLAEDRRGRRGLPGRGRPSV